MMAIFPAAGITLGDLLVMILCTLAILVPGALLAVAAYAVLALPQRRLSRARFFLDLLSTGLSRGKRPEETIVELSSDPDLPFGRSFTRSAALIQQGAPLVAVFNENPAFLPPAVNATLRAGVEMGDLQRVLPACDDMLRDGPAQSRHVLNYAILWLTAFAPTICAVIAVLQVFVLPKYRVIMEDLSEGLPPMPEYPALEIANVLASVMAVASVIVLLGLILHAGGPRLVRWLQLGSPSVLDRLAMLVPWKRKRAIRDFTGLLSILLDAGLPEERALRLAAECCSNGVMRERVLRSAQELRGVGLVDALIPLDSTGELRWRLTNVTRSGSSFTTALTGWREALDARAFQQEQASAHVITSLLVVLNGVTVGAVAVSLFGMLIHVVETAALW